MPERELKFSVDLLRALPTKHVTRDAPFFVKPLLHLKEHESSKRFPLHCNWPLVIFTSFGQLMPEQGFAHCQDLFQNIIILIITSGLTFACR